jgi:hypothetical protein
MSDNLKIYDAVREVPPTALKTINGGRMNGKSDINPMWRIKTLTEQFGACGIGWKYEVVRFWLEPGANGEVSAFAQINLFFRKPKDVESSDFLEWSEPIPGIGGSAFIAKETKGLFTSDECYKMALTDAISVACKALGVAADVYWNKDNTKYDRPNNQPDKPQGQPPKPPQNASESPTNPPSAKPKQHDTAHQIAFALIKRFGEKQASEMLFPITGYKSTKEIPDKELKRVLDLISGFEEIV